MNELEELITYIKEGCIFRSESPFMEIRKVSGSIDLLHVQVQLVHCMCSINEKRNSFLLKECLQSLHWQYYCGH